MHTIALDSSGNVWAWGYNSRGQLGDANRSGTSYQTPSEVQNLPVVITKIFTKFDTNFALDASGNVYAWGENGSGQFGSPTSDGLHHGINYDPFKIAGIPAMSQIAPGMYSVTALDTSGNVWTWGNNTNGYLGDGSAKTSWHSPVQIGISNAIWVATGQTDSFAVLASGALKGWGWNFAGELGIGNTTEQDTPVTVSGISSASGVDISSTHAVVWNAISSNTAVISSVSASVTPNSALYEMKATANFSGVACPARLIAIVGGTTRTSSSLCSTGGTAPTSKDWNFSVTALSPNSSVPISLLIDDDNGAKTYASSVTTPKPPVWIATGDSFSSGHHQDTDEPCAVNTYVAAQVANSLFGTYAGTCLDKDGSGATSLTKNDAAYSWATRARNSLMTALGIPTVWKMTIDVVADSGAPASGFANAGGQQANMISDLTARAGSWNIVTTSGGADDVNFGAALQSFYENASTWNTKPWQVTSRSSCPDTDAIYSRVGSTGSSTNTALANLFLAASNADANVRKLAITYPYVLESTNTCEGYDSGTAPHNGAKQVIDALDANISSLSSIGVHVVDLRSVTGFGSSPMSDIQQTRYFGYPHPSSAGQNDIASAVNSALS